MRKAISYSLVYTAKSNLRASFSIYSVGNRFITWDNWWNVPTWLKSFVRVQSGFGHFWRLNFARRILSQQCSSTHFVLGVVGHGFCWWSGENGSIQTEKWKITRNAGKILKEHIYMKHSFKSKLYFESTWCDRILAVKQRKTYFLKYESVSASIGWIRLSGS